MVRAYQHLWQGRAAAQNASSIDEIRSLAEAELADRLTHPRLRKDRVSKLAEIEGSIRASSLSVEEKEMLVGFYQSIQA